MVGGLAVKFLGQTFAGVRFDGPGPVSLHGRVTVETFLKDFEWEDTFVFGRPESPPAIPPRRAVDVLVAEEFVPTTVRATGVIDPSVMLTSPDRQGDFAVLAPLSGLAWTQHRVPLGLPVDRLDGTPLGALQTVKATAPGQTGVEPDRFAPGSFITLTKAQALATPTYDLLEAGVQVSAGGTTDGEHTDATSAPQILRKVRGELKFGEVLAVVVAGLFPSGVLNMRCGPSAGRGPRHRRRLTAPTRRAGPDEGPDPSSRRAPQASARVSAEHARPGRFAGGPGCPDRRTDLVEPVDAVRPTVPADRHPLSPPVAPQRLLS